MKHGLSHTKEYHVWVAMRTRCNNPESKTYENYGGRGISVCARWDKSFGSFYADMGICPDGYQIDRMDNNGDYHPENCKWVSKAENSRNKRNNVYVEIDGVKKVVTDWAKQYGVGVSTFRNRINLLGWTKEDAITKPIWKGFSEYCNNGHLLSEVGFIVSKKGKKRCKQCQREYDKKRKRKKSNVIEEQMDGSSW